MFIISIWIPICSIYELESTETNSDSLNSFWILLYSLNFISTHNSFFHHSEQFKVNNVQNLYIAKYQSDNVLAVQ